MTRVPARWVLHVADTWGFPTAVRGLSRFVPTLQRLGYLERYERAALGQAMRAARNGGFLEERPEEGFAAEEVEDADDPDAPSKKYEIEELPDLGPDGDGQWWRLPPGLSFNPADPNKPQGGDYRQFTGGQLQAASAALGLSYAGLSGDYTGSNYSSSRAALIDEHDEWRTIQSMLGDRFLGPIWRRVIEYGVMRGDLVPTGDPAEWIERASMVEFHGPGMRHIDPAKDARGTIELVKAGLLAPSEAIAMSGRDPDQVFEQIARDRDRLTELGLDDLVGTPAPPPPGDGPPQEDDDNDDPDDDKPDDPDD